MSHLVLTIGPAHTLRQAARMMSARRIGAAVVIDPEHAGVGILTERDLLDSIAAGEDPDAELVAQHRTEHLVYASPDWTLEEAATAMVRGGFRHLVVVDGQENPDAAWYYPDPKPAARSVKYHVAFWRGVEVTTEKEKV